MKKYWWWILIVLVGGFFLWRIYGQKAKENPVETTPDYQLYQNKDGKFSLMVPTGWQAEEATPGAKFVARVTFRPLVNSIKVGNIGEISLTVVASPSAGQELSTQQEFDNWLRAPMRTATEGAIVKLANEFMAGQPAVRLAELEPIPEQPGIKFWSVTTWMRQNGINYYVNMMGNGKNYESESAPFSWMLSKFSLIP